MTLKAPNLTCHVSSSLLAASPTKFLETERNTRPTSPRRENPNQILFSSFPGDSNASQRDSVRALRKTWEQNYANQFSNYLLNTVFRRRALESNSLGHLLHRIRQWAFAASAARVDFVIGVDKLLVQRLWLLYGGLLKKYWHRYCKFTKLTGFSWTVCLKTNKSML